MMRETVHNFVKIPSNNNVTKYGLLAALFLLSFFLAFQVKNWYVERNEKAAQQLFSQAYGFYEEGSMIAERKSDHKEKIAEHFDDARQTFELLRETHKGSKYASYAEAFEAEIALEQGDTIKALEILKKFVESLDLKSPLYFLYKTKVALMMVDFENKEAGLEELKKLATESLNPYADTALFFYGNYYWISDDIATAKESFLLLKEKYPESVWYQAYVADYLAQIA